MLLFYFNVNQNYDHRSQNSVAYKYHKISHFYSVPDTVLSWGQIMASVLQVKITCFAESKIMASDSISSVQFSSVAESCLTLCDPVNRSTPGLPVHHKLPEFTQTHAHQVGDAIQPSHLLLSPSPPTPNPSLHQGLFQ